MEICHERRTHAVVSTFIVNILCTKNFIFMSVYADYRVFEKCFTTKNAVEFEGCLREISIT